MIRKIGNKQQRLWLNAALTAAAKGRVVLMDYYGRLGRVRSKGREGLVSEADLASERVIRSYLKKATPQYAFLGEEESFARGHRSEAEHKPLGRWIVDPLDGTTNYVHRFPVFCISIALEVQGQIEVGVVHIPLWNKTYYAVQGAGAYCDQTKLQVSGTNKVEKSLLATGFNALRPRELKRQLQIFTQLIDKARGVRRAGSAAIDLCMVAEGVFDGYWESRLNPWDVAAGVLLVREAGGLVTDYSGREFKLESKELLSSNKKIHSQLLKSVVLSS